MHTTILLMSVLAAAEVADAGTAAPRAPDPDTRIGVSAGGMYVKAEDGDAWRVGLSLTPEYERGGRFVLSLPIRLAMTRLSVCGNAGTKFCADLVLPWQLSIGAGIRYRFLTLWRLDFSAYGQYEFPIAESDARIENIRLEGKTPDGFDADLLGRHVEIRHDWRKYAFGLTVRGTFGAWRPFIDVGFASDRHTLITDFDSRLNDLFAKGDVAPDRFYDISQESFAYAVGTDWDVGGGVRLNAQTTIVPLKDGIYVSGEIGVMIPIGAPPKPAPPSP